MVEQFNRTTKTMLRKHVAKFGVQLDLYLSGVLLAYHNAPHSATVLMIGFDYRHPTEAQHYHLSFQVIPTSQIIAYGR